MRRRLAVRDDEADGLGIPVPVEEAPGEHECVVEVGALDVTRREVGKLLGIHRPCQVGEGDHLQGIERVRRCRECLECHRGGLGCAPGVVHHHGEGLVDEECDGRTRACLGFTNLEVLGAQSR